MISGTQLSSPNSPLNWKIDVGEYAVAGISGQSFRKEVIDAASCVLCHRATIGPIVIAVEDVHWADSMTLELLQPERSGATNCRYY